MFIGPTVGLLFGVGLLFFANRIHKFLEQVLEDADPSEIDGSGADALAAQKVIAAAIESLENEVVVSVD